MSLNNNAVGDSGATALAEAMKSLPNLKVRDKSYPLFLVECVEIAAIYALQVSFYGRSQMTKKGRDAFEQCKCLDQVEDLKICNSEADAESSDD